MATVNVVSVAAHRRIYWLKLIGLVQRSAATWRLYYIQSNELGELSQWLCHDDSAINTGIGIIIIIIIIITTTIYSLILLYRPDCIACTLWSSVREISLASDELRRPPFCLDNEAERTQRNITE